MNDSVPKGDRRVIPLVQAPESTEQIVGLLAGVSRSILQIPDAIQVQYRAMQRQADALDALVVAQNKGVLEPVLMELRLLLDSIMSVNRQLMKKAKEVRFGKSVPYREAAELMDGVAVQLISILKRNGVRIINDVNVAFDPEVHSIERIEAGGGSEPVIKEVLQPGFLFQDLVLRKAVVVVAKPHSTVDKEANSNGPGLVSDSDPFDPDLGLPISQGCPRCDS